MSITGFDDAIRDNVQSYSNNLDTLRANGIRQRNNALAGIQSEVEKYGEMAKLGLEIPVAVEGLKAVGGRAKDLVNFIKGAPAKLSEAKGAIKTALTQGQDAVQSAKSQLGGARDTINQTISDRRDALSSRLDSLKVQGRGSAQDAMDRGQRFAGETKSNVQGFQKVKAPDETKAQGVDDEGTEMTETSDANYFADRPQVRTYTTGDADRPNDADFSGRAGSGGPDSTNASARSYESRVSSGNQGRRPRLVSEDKSGDMFEPDTDEYGHPINWQDGGEESLFNESSVKQSVRSLDSGFENTRGEGIGNMSRDAGVGRNYDEANAVARQGPAPDFKPPRPGSKAPGPGQYDDELAKASAPTPTPTDDPASSISNEGGGGIGNLVEKEATSIAGDEAGGLEEGLGAGLLASGIFAPLGALLEGLGAITEVASVGAGAYGAVQSFAEQGVEETLRNKALPAVSQPKLDLGGRVVAPLVG